MDIKDDFEKILEERFARLPAVIQNAITSADVESHLRELANRHQLHLDQWNLLENEVMLTLLGMQEMSALKDNIVKTVGVSDEVGKALADDIAQVVFQPIRNELERQLAHPDAHAEQASDVDAVRTATLAQEAAPANAPTATPVPTITPATPPAPPPEVKAVRADPSPAYTPQVPSHERKDIAGDPYREQVN